MTGPARREHERGAGRQRRRARGRQRAGADRLFGGVELTQIKRVLKLTVLVASTSDFHEQHLVANGASNLIVGVLGDIGKHARAAFGVASLPLGAAVEAEAIVEVE